MLHYTPPQPFIIMLSFKTIICSRARVWTAAQEPTLAFVSPSFSSFSPGLLTPPLIHNHWLDPFKLL